ncbi:UDP-glucose dehydrogenase family protein [Sporolactobacillus laevolacticus]|uniref:UDP-glucose dehydrogenase family protein n=1 Tax=Sporolactobacillus laevolacticus TaxID=33018 RepID=UPI0025B286E8|nr:UDP-glucose/GDP-mannose dehydrogenase family protein [Sporolactobacillus laevolacticus]MDN3955229.1 UDP-glucose/GDP-mannose dehydrogenase family protein [Sporolactobacillus laevolacticus]
MDICVVGAGYVGLTTSAVLAELGHRVTCVDQDREKIELLNQGGIPIYEKGLKSLVETNRKSRKLFFSDQVIDSLSQHQVIMIAVGTPSNEDGSTNLTYVKNVVELIAKSIGGHKTIITKSTVPPGTNEWMIRSLVDQGVDRQLFDVASNPEFLKEGTAVDDSLHPHRIVIGAENKRAAKRVKSLFRGIHAPVIRTSLTGAELIKYASNAFLAAKISFVNEIARICDVYGADIKDVQKGIAADPRINPFFLNAGLGYGGSCFPKDLSALIHSAKLKAIDPILLEAVIRVNETQIDVYLNKLMQRIPGLKNKQITVWGLTFKPDTDDLRASQSIKLIQRLLQTGCSVHTYDPVTDLKNDQVIHHSKLYESVEHSDALIIATEWHQFLEADWERVKKNMNGDLLLDCRNILDPDRAKKYGFYYVGVGRS